MKKQYKQNTLRHWYLVEYERNNEKLIYQNSAGSSLESCGTSLP